MKKVIVIIAIVGAVATGGYLFYKSQYEKLLDMQYTPLGIQVDISDDATTKAKIKLQISSDATIEAVIKRLDLEVSVNGVYLGKINEDREIIIPAKGYSIVDINISVSNMQVITNAVNLAGQIFKQKDAELTLKGKVKVKTAFLTVNVPVNYTESVKYLMS